MKKKFTIQDMQNIAKQRGGSCLSKEYINAKKLLRWKCDEGHEWDAPYDRIKQKNWCRICSYKRRGKNRRLTIEEMNTVAQKRGGKCLSGEYKTMHSKLHWECKEGHRWEATPGNIKAGKWCPDCGGTKKKSIEEMQSLAQKKGGKCLSKRYKNTSSKLRFRCSVGHVWKSAVSSILQGSWCPKCRGRSPVDRKGVNRVLTIIDAKGLARKRGGKCLSDEYVNNQTLMEWKCKFGHVWKTAYGHISLGTWCPECSTGISERICRAYFEQLFMSSFPRSHPNWLKNSRGNQMELDGYSEELSLAFEHHGEQHYTTKSVYINTKKDLIQRKKDDLNRRQLCKQKDIRLIEIPELFSRTPLDQLSRFIYEECKKLNVRSPRGFLSKTIDLKKAYSTSASEETLTELHGYAQEMGGKLTSKHFVHWHHPLEWKCKYGHCWTAKPTNIKSGKWCPECSGNKPLTIKQMKELAKSRGGKLLSKKIINARTPLKWQCKEGHKWEAAPMSVRNNNSWCPNCAQKEMGKKRRLSIEEMRELANERGGKCLSKKYIVKTKLLWQCREGHKWKTLQNSIRRGSWCPDCAKYKQRNTIEEMKLIAKAKGGQCLSVQYIHSTTKLKWQCANGHTWLATPKNVKHGNTWCPKCKGK